MKKTVKRKPRLGMHPVAVALKNAGPLPANLIQNMRLLEWSAIEAFAKGNASITEFTHLEELMCVCACSAERGIGPEAEPVCHQALQILNSIKRGQDAGPWRMDAAQIEVMRELQGFHDLQRAAVDRGTYSTIVDAAAELMGRGKTSG